MRPRTTISGSELLLGVIAIRLAALVLVGWPQAKAIRSQVADAAFDDMLLHD